MPMNSEAPKHGGSGGELERRVTAVEARLSVIEKTMVTAEVFQRELAAFRDEIRLAIGGIHEQIGRLRDEMHVGLGELRTEMQAQHGALRTEMQALHGALRTEMQTMDGALRVEIAKTPFETFKWLLAAAGLAAAMATAIYNIWFR